jgi:hypothetical protein
LFRMQVEDPLTLTQLPKRHVIHFLQGKGPGKISYLCLVQTETTGMHHRFLPPLRYASLCFKIGQNSKVSQGDPLLVKFEMLYPIMIFSSGYRYFCLSLL